MIDSSGERRFALGAAEFATESATVGIEVRSAAEARAMGIAPATLNIEVQAKEGRVERDLVAPRAYIEAMSLEHHGIRSISDLADFRAKVDGDLYIYDHRRVHTIELVIRRHGRGYWLDWTADRDTVSLSATPQKPLVISTPIAFEGVTVYEEEPARAFAMLSKAFAFRGLSQQPATIIQPGRRRFVLFGARLGRLAVTRFVPRVG
jgi:hypothetical protein